MLLDKHPVAWFLLKRMIRSQFPQVRQISAETLAGWLAQTDDHPAPLLLDTRTEAEFAVSHLLNARHFEQDDPSANDPNILEDVASDQLIVAYCSVGYRSAQVCDRLQTQGYTQVVNLEGSLFHWANQGRPVYRGNQVVQQVHPYNSLWGLLLSPGLRTKRMFINETLEDV